MPDPNVEKTDTTEQAAEENSPNLESKVEEKLAAMQDNAADEDVDTEVDEEKVEVQDDDKEAAGSDDDSPILPTGHRRAALARGWTGEEIDWYLENKPDDATEKFESIYNDWQKESSQWSARGRQLKAAEQEDADSLKQTDDTLKPLEKFDTKALIEEHGNEDLITALTGPLNQVIDQVNSSLKKVSASQEFVQTSEEEALAKVVQEFLTSKDMKSFKDVYGTDIETLSKEQVDTRMELFSEADDIIAGAIAHGKQITVESALQRAHANVTKDLKDTAIRSEIRKSIKKRTKTLSGSKQKTTPVNDGEQISRDELIARTEKRMQAMREKV